MASHHPHRRGGGRSRRDRSGLAGTRQSLPGAMVAAGDHVLLRRAGSGAPALPSRRPLVLDERDPAGSRAVLRQPAHGDPGPAPGDLGGAGREPPPAPAEDGVQPRPVHRPDRSGHRRVPYFCGAGRSARPRWVGRRPAGHIGGAARRRRSHQHRHSLVGRQARSQRGRRGAGAGSDRRGDEQQPGAGGHHGAVDGARVGVADVGASGGALPRLPGLQRAATRARPARIALPRHPSAARVAAAGIGLAGGRLPSSGHVRGRDRRDHPLPRRPQAQQLPHRGRTGRPPRGHGPRRPQLRTRLLVGRDRRRCGGVPHGRRGGTGTARRRRGDSHRGGHRLPTHR